MKKSCPHCSEKFDMSRPDKKYCSKRCGHNANAKKRRDNRTPQEIQADKDYWQEYYKNMSRAKRRQRTIQSRKWSKKFYKTEEGKRLSREWASKYRKKKRQRLILEGKKSKEGFVIQPHKCKACDVILKYKKHKYCKTLSCVRKRNTKRCVEYYHSLSQKKKAAFLKRSREYQRKRAKRKANERK